MYYDQFCFWVSVDESPKKSGYYLVVQENNEHRKYRWVRYYDGTAWYNIREEKYGPITHWSELLALP